MKKKTIYLVLSGLTVLALASCGPVGSSSSQSSEVPASNSLTADISPSISIQKNNMLKEALKKDYSNMTVSLRTREYDSFFGEPIEDGIVEYYYNGYTVVSYNQDEEIKYSYYHDYQDNSYLWFEKEANNSSSKAGWLNKGWRDADLSLGHTYFDFKDVLKNLNPDDVAFINGAYFVNDRETCREMAFSFLGELYAQSIAVNYIGFEVSNDGYLTRILALEDPNDDNGNYMDIVLSNFGSTIFPDSKLPAAPNSNNVIEYWQYKGWSGPWVDKYVDQIAIAVSGDVKTEEGYDAVLEMDESITLTSSLLPADYNVEPSLEWHASTPGVVTVGAGTKQFTGKVTGEAGGETEVYATYTANGKTVTSNKLKVKVIGTPEQNKEDAIYDFTFIYIDEDGEVTADNKVKTNTKPYTITTTNPSSGKVEIRDGKNSSEGVYKEGEKAVLFLNSGTNVVYGVDSFIMFDFGDEQQVSSISLYYAMFYNSGMNNLSWLSKAAIETSNDGENWETIDILEEVKSNVSVKHKKLLEKEFAPASKVRIATKCNMIGKEMNLAISDVAFMANENCSNYVEPSGKVDVESVNLTAAETELYVGKTLSMAAKVNPSNATDKALTWHSTNEEVATVNNGVVTGVSAGKAEIYAVADGVSSNHVEVTVNNLPSLDTNMTGSFKGEVGLDVLTLTFNNNALVAKLNEDSYNLEYKDYINGASVSDRFFVFSNENGDYLNVRYSSYNSKLIFQGKLGEKNLNYSEIVKYIPATALTLSSNKTTLKVGESATITVSLTPNNATGIDVNDEYKWKVNEEGEGVIQFYTETSGNNSVKALKAGIVTLTATNGEGIVGSITLTVPNPVAVASITISSAGDKNEVEVNSKLQLYAAAIGANGETPDNDTVTWSISNDSENTNAAEVSKTGVVTGKEEGTVTIVATANDGSGVKNEFTITVVKSEGVIPSDIVGIWSGQDSENSYTIIITINSDGKLEMDIDGDVLLFEYSSKRGTEYTFSHGKDYLDVTLESNGKLTVSLDGGNMGLFDDEYCMTMDEEEFTKVS